MLTANDIEIHTTPNKSSTARKHGDLIISLQQEHGKFFHNGTSCFTNFDHLQWGQTKRLVHVKPSSLPETHNNNDAVASSSGSDNTEHAGGAHTIGAVREKLLLDFRKESEELLADAVSGRKRSPAKEVVELERPWKLRARRTVCKGAAEGRSGSPGRNADVDRKKAEVVGEKARREKFAVALSKAEIEADFLKMTGAKPPRRPKKRPRNVQKQIDVLTPGSYLTEITADMYKVPDNAH